MTISKAKQAKLSCAIISKPLQIYWPPCTSLPTWGLTFDLQVNTCCTPYLPIQGWREWERKQADVMSHEFSMIHDNQQSKASKAELCNHIKALADLLATLHKPAYLGFDL